MKHRKQPQQSLSPHSTAVQHTRYTTATAAATHCRPRSNVVRNIPPHCRELDETWPHCLTQLCRLGTDSMWSSSAVSCSAGAQQPTHLRQLHKHQYGDTAKADNQAAMPAHSTSPSLPRWPDCSRNTTNRQYAQKEAPTCTLFTRCS